MKHLQYFKEHVNEGKIMLKGDTYGDIVSKGKIGDEIEIDGMAFALRHDVTKTTKLIPGVYKIAKISPDYTKDTSLFTIQNADDTFFTLIGKKTQTCGMKLIKK
jgi:hypothetical protein